MKQTEHFKIFGKKYQRNLQFKINVVYFEYNGKRFEVEVLYIKPYNRYAFVQGPISRETDEEFSIRLSKMGLLEKDMQEEFLTALNKYSKLGPMKEFDVK